MEIWNVQCGEVNEDAKIWDCYEGVIQHAYLVVESN